MKSLARRPVSFIFAFQILMGLWVFSTQSLASPCSVATKISFETLEDGAKHASFEMPPDWETEAAVSTSGLKAFKDRISAAAPTSPITLISRQRDFFKEDEHIWNRMSQVIDGHLGKIEAAGCLETAVFSAILSEYSQNDQVEFSVYVLKQADRYHVHVLTWGLIHVPPSLAFDKLLDRDLRAGGQYYVNLHNHPFFLSNSSGDIGGVIVPSDPDFTVYKEQRQKQGLENAWVTNGFSTFKMKSSEFDN